MSTVLSSLKCLILHVFYLHKWGASGVFYVFLVKWVDVDPFVFSSRKILAYKIVNYSISSNFKIQPHFPLHYSKLFSIVYLKVSKPYNKRITAPDSSSGFFVPKICDFRAKSTIYSNSMPRGRGIQHPKGE